MGEQDSQNRGEARDKRRMWTFAKGGHELTVEHWFEGDAVRVMLTRADDTGAETTRVYDFSDAEASDQFNADLDASLLQFGWVFIGYLPNRRTQPDRRHDARVSDRRRWWTDGGTFLE